MVVLIVVSGLDYKHVESGHPNESGVKDSTVGYAHQVIDGRSQPIPETIMSCCLLNNGVGAREGMGEVAVGRDVGTSKDKVSDRGDAPQVLDDRLMGGEVRGVRRSRASLLTARSSSDTPLELFEFNKSNSRMLEIEFCNWC
ncbi:hypothetical protein U1Q18_036016 [Sarracenia purpurea var. burkii]